jgi:hypothetical protein
MEFSLGAVNLSLAMKKKKKQRQCIVLLCGLIFIDNSILNSFIADVATRKNSLPFYSIQFSFTNSVMFIFLICFSYLFALQMQLLWEAFG